MILRALHKGIFRACPPSTDYHSGNARNIAATSATKSIPAAGGRIVRVLRGFIEENKYGIRYFSDFFAQPSTLGNIWKFNSHILRNKQLRLQF